MSDIIPIYTKRRDQAGPGFKLDIKEDNIMALKDLFGWGQQARTAAPTACGSACGAGDKPAEKPTACGSACGAGDKPADKPTACGSACGAGDKQ